LYFGVYHTHDTVFLPQDKTSVWSRRGGNCATIRYFHEKHKPVADYVQQIRWLKQRLQMPLPGLSGQEKMAARVQPMPAVIPADAKLSAVLCLLFPIEAELHVLLIRRNTDRSAHSGQVGFPGGRQEATDKSLLDTALRETLEELGIGKDSLEVLGALTPLYIPVSNFNVYPFVAYCERLPETSPNEREVAAILQVPLATLWHAGHKTVTDVTSPVAPQIIRKVNAYQLPDGTIIWGATAMMLSELETVMSELGLTNE
jgi:8-oxo-dGTP pyrophosphatase MutT (NUDIX family)